MEQLYVHSTFTDKHISRNSLGRRTCSKAFYFLFFCMTIFTWGGHSIKQTAVFVAYLWPEGSYLNPANSGIAIQEFLVSLRLQKGRVSLKASAKTPSIVQNKGHAGNVEIKPLSLAP